jgi:hypothetical protein
MAAQMRTQLEKIWRARSWKIRFWYYMIIAISADFAADVTSLWMAVSVTLFWHGHSDERLLANYRL